MPDTQNPNVVILPATKQRGPRVCEVIIDGKVVQTSEELKSLRETLPDQLDPLT